MPVASDVILRSDACSPFTRNELFEVLVLAHAGSLGSLGAVRWTSTREPFVFA